MTRAAVRVATRPRSPLVACSPGPSPSASGAPGASGPPGRVGRSTTLTVGLSRRGRVARPGPRLPVGRPVGDARALRHDADDRPGRHARPGPRRDVDGRRPDDDRAEAPRRRHVPRRRGAVRRGGRPHLDLPDDGRRSGDRRRRSPTTRRSSTRSGAATSRSVESIEAVDATIVRILLTRPDAALLDALGRTFVVPPDYVGRVGNAGLRREAGRDRAVHVRRAGQGRPHDRGRERRRTGTARAASRWSTRAVFRPIPDAVDPPERARHGRRGRHRRIRRRTSSLGSRRLAAASRRSADARRYMIWFSPDGKGDARRGPEQDAGPGDGPRGARQAGGPARPQPRGRSGQTIIDTLLAGPRRADDRACSCPATSGSIPISSRSTTTPTRPDAARRRRLPGRLRGRSRRLHVRPDRPPRGGGGRAGEGRRDGSISSRPRSASSTPIGVPARRTRCGRRGWRSATRTSTSSSGCRTDGVLSRFSDPAIDALIDEQAAEYDAARASRDRPRDRQPDARDAAGALPVELAEPVRRRRRRSRAGQPHLLGYLPVVGVAGDRARTGAVAGRR